MDSEEVKETNKQKKIAGLLCIKMRQNGGEDWTKQRGPGVWPQHSTGVRGEGHRRFRCVGFKHATQSCCIFCYEKPLCLRRVYTAWFIYNTNPRHQPIPVITGCSGWGRSNLPGPLDCHHLTEVMVSQVHVPVSLYSYKSLCQNSSVGTLQTRRFLYVNYTFKSW